VVYEPLADGPVDVRNAPRGEPKPHRNVVVRTVVMRATSGVLPALVPDFAADAIEIDRLYEGSTTLDARLAGAGSIWKREPFLDDPEWDLTNPFSGTLNVSPPRKLSSRLEAVDDSSASPERLDQVLRLQEHSRFLNERRTKARFTDGLSNTVFFA